MRSRGGRGPSFASSSGDIVSLSKLHTGEHGRVVELGGARGMLARLTALGFTPGTDLMVIQNYGRGPLIIRVRDARIALGRGEAERVYVRKSAV